MSLILLNTIYVAMIDTGISQTFYELYRQSLQLEYSNESSH